MVKNISTIGKYYQRMLWKWICIVNPFDLYLKRIHTKKKKYIYIYISQYNSQQYIVWVKIIHFYFMPKIIRILSKISYCKYSKTLIFLLIICIAKNFICTILKVIL